MSFMFNALKKDITVNGISLRIAGIYHMECSDGWVMNIHRHSSFEFHYLVEGSIYTVIDDEEYKVEEGYFYMLPPGILHRHRHGEGVKSRGYAVRWEMTRDNKYRDGYGLTYESRKFYDALYLAHSRPVKDTGIVIQKLQNIFSPHRAGRNIMQNQMEFLQLVLGISEFYTGHHDKETGIDHSSLEDMTILSAVKFIEENYGQKITPADVASSVYRSLEYLSGLFNKYKGCTINDFLNNVRLEKAQRLIICTDRDIDEIIRETGFSNAESFRSLYEKYYKSDPNNLRNTIPD